MLAGMRQVVQYKLQPGQLNSLVTRGVNEPVRPCTMALCWRLRAAHSGWMSSRAQRRRILLAACALHAVSATCTLSNNTGCPTIPCGPDYLPATVCYPGTCANLLGKCNAKEHGVQYYCCSTQRSMYYKCESGQCVQRPDGIDRGACEKACVPPPLPPPPPPPGSARFLSINAITLATLDMRAAFDFYSGLGLNCTFGCAAGANWTTFGGRELDEHSFHINLYPKPAGHDSAPRQPWGRCIFYVSDVDAVYALALERGLEPEFAPRNADWGERYFHILDPSGHELAIAAPLHPPRSVGDSTGHADPGEP